MRKLFLSTFLVAYSLVAFAQENVEFTADRPGASTGPSVVGQGVIQLEQKPCFHNNGCLATLL